MRRSIVIMLAITIGLAISGCSTVKRATGQLDDSVLPGERENVLPPDLQTARDPKITGQQSADGLDEGSVAGDSAECLPEEQNCISQKPIAGSKPKNGINNIQ